MPNWDAYAEAERRGILPPEKAAIYAEAKRRGLIPGAELELAPSGPYEDPFATVGSAGQVASLAGQVLDVPFKPLHWVRDAATGLMKKVPILKQPFNPAPAEAGFSPEPIARGQMDRFPGPQDAERSGTTLAEVIPQVAELAVAPAYAKGAGVVARSLKSPIQTYAKVSRALGREAYLGQGAAERWWASALKPVPSTDPKIRAEMFQTQMGIDALLPEPGIPMSKTGLEAATKVLNAKVEGINKIFDVGRREGTKLSVDKILKTSEDLQATLKKAGIPTPALDEEIALFRSQHPSGFVDMGDAEPIKKILNAYTSGHWGELSQAAMEARKLRAQGIVNTAAEIFPELKELGEGSRRLINLREAMDRRLATLSNKDMVGLMDPLTGMVTDSAKANALLVLFRRFMERPSIKSRIAMALADRGVPNPMNVIKSRMIGNTLGSQKGQMSVTPEELPPTVTGGEEYLPGGVWEKPWVRQQREQQAGKLAPAPNTAGQQTLREFDLNEARRLARTTPTWTGPKQIVQDQGPYGSGVPGTEPIQVGEVSPVLPSPVGRETPPRTWSLADMKKAATDTLKSTRGAREVTLRSDLNAVADAWKKVSARLGYSHVPIADIMDETGMSFDSLKPIILQAMARGDIVGSEASWTMGSAATSQRVKDATLDLKSGIRISDIKWQGRTTK